MSDNQHPLKGQTAIVTGAGQGIGLAICIDLAKQGVNIVLNDVEESLAVEAADKIKRIMVIV